MQNVHEVVAARLDVFRRDDPAPRQPWITGPTFDLVQQRIAMCVYMRRFPRVRACLLRPARQ